MSDEKKISEHVQKLVDEVNGLSKEDKEQFDYATWNEYTFGAGLDASMENMYKAAKLLDGDNRNTFKVALDDVRIHLDENIDEVLAMPDEDEECEHEEVCEDCKKATDKERN